MQHNQGRRSGRRSSFAIALSALALSACTAIVNSIQGAPLREIYPGQESSGSLSSERHSRIRVSTTTVLGPPSTTYSTTESFHGDHWKFSTQSNTTRNTTLQNTYAREDSFSGTSEIWKIATDFLPAPTEVVILVQGDGFLPAAVFYANATERQATNGGDDGMRLSDYSAEGGVVAGLTVLEPGKHYYLLVQHSGEVSNASYRVAVFPIE